LPRVCKIITVRSPEKANNGNTHCQALLIDYGYYRHLKRFIDDFWRVIPLVLLACLSIGNMGWQRGFGHARQAFWGSFNLTSHLRLHLILSIVFWAARKGLD